MQNVDFSAALRRFFRIELSGESSRLQSSLPLSASSLRKTRTLTGLSMLLAMYVVLDYTATISINQHLEISFSFLAIAISGMLFGPVPAMLCSGLGDILMYILNPRGPYFPGFTITAMLGGLIYGVAFYRRDIDLVHIVIAKLIVNIIINTLLNSVNLHILYGNLTQVLLAQRASANLIKLPVDIAMLSIILPTAQTISKRLRWVDLK